MNRDEQIPIDDLVAELWLEIKPVAVARVESLRGAVAAARTGGLRQEQRVAARDEAHKLAGGLGGYGFHSASELARLVEELLSTAELATAAEVARLDELVRRLGAEIA